MLLKLFLYKQLGVGAYLLQNITELDKRYDSVDSRSDNYKIYVSTRQYGQTRTYTHSPTGIQTCDLMARAA
jgi:hypothetical protein